MKRILPKRISPQEEIEERILAYLLNMAVERDNKLTPAEIDAKNWS